jgi:hypothetical protein
MIFFLVVALGAGSVSGMVDADGIGSTVAVTMGTCFSTVAIAGTVNIDADGAALAAGFALCPTGTNCMTTSTTSDTAMTPLNT